MATIYRYRAGKTQHHFCHYVFVMEGSTPMTTVVEEIAFCRKLTRDNNNGYDPWWRGEFQLNFPRTEYSPFVATVEEADRIVASLHKDCEVIPLKDDSCPYCEAHHVASETYHVIGFPSY